MEKTLHFTKSRLSLSERRRADFLVYLIMSALAVAGTIIF